MELVPDVTMKADLQEPRTPQESRWDRQSVLTVGGAFSKVGFNGVSIVGRQIAADLL